MSWPGFDWKEVAGLKVSKVTADEWEALLRFEGGRALEITLDADCCSSSTFSQPAQFMGLEGATVLGAEERAEGDEPAYYKPSKDDDVLRWHFLVFTTDKGHVTIDWRNNSNGYYDGSVEARWKP